MKNPIARSLTAIILYTLITFNNTNSQSKDNMDIICKNLAEDQMTVGPSAETSESDNYILATEDTKPQYTINLFQNYPDPFNEITLIEFSTAASKYLKIYVSDEGNNEIETLVEGEIEEGNHFVFYKPSPNLNEGIYNCQMEVLTHDRSELLDEKLIKMIYTKDKTIVLKK